MKFPKKLLRGKLTFGKLIAVLLIWLAWVGVSHFAGNADFGTAPLELDTIPAAHAESGITGGKIRYALGMSTITASQTDMSMASGASIQSLNRKRRLLERLLFR